MSRATVVAPHSSRYDCGRTPRVCYNLVNYADISLVRRIFSRMVHLQLDLAKGYSSVCAACRTDIWCGTVIVLFQRAQFRGCQTAKSGTRIEWPQSHYARSNFTFQKNLVLYSKIKFKIVKCRKARSRFGKFAGSTSRLRMSRHLVTRKDVRSATTT